MGDRSDDCDLPRASAGVSGSERARMRCADCGERFLRSEARIPAKGTLVCPACDSRAVRDVTS
jgi:DNA-directed RNA polymerase subunit RPC12/RpoP